MPRRSCCRRYGVTFNTLTCVNRFNASRPLDVYRFLRRELGSTYLQFIPIVEINGFETTAPQTWDPARLPVVGTPQARPGHPDSVVTDWSVDPEEYGYFLCKVWDEWLARDLGKVLVNFCETLVAQHMGLPSQLCVHGEFCGKGVAHRARRQRLLLRPLRLSRVPARQHPRALAGRHGVLADAGQVRLCQVRDAAAYCRQCEYLSDCWGECPKNRLVRTPAGEAGLNYLCPGLKRFYAHIQRDLPQLVRGARQGASAQRSTPWIRPPTS